MDPISIGVILLVGWCGTPYPIRWVPPHHWFPPMPPKPEPICPKCGQIFSIIGSYVLPIVIANGLPKGVDVPSLAVGAYIGAQLFGAGYLMFAGMRK